MTIDILAGIEFREPPAAKRRRPNSESWDKRAAEFVHRIAWRRGEWAVFRTGLNKGNAYVICSRYRKRHQNTEWRAAAEPDGTWTVFARVVYV